MTNNEKKTGVLVYEEINNYFNIGDYIQSLAALGFADSNNRPIYINRENASSYDGEPLKLIMNGWFTHTKTNNWIPSDKITPLFVSFHLNSSAISTVLNKEGHAYFKKHEPIGCRDYFTVETLKEHGIEAYFTGCLTLTLDRYKNEESERDGVYIVDPLYNYPTFNYIRNYPKGIFRYILNGHIFKLSKLKKHLSNIFSDELLNNAVYINQSIPGNNMSHDEKFIMADNLLKKYATAKLVITSRIHCALPCLAMGTPVIYINGFDTIGDSCRMDGIIDLFNKIDVDSETGEFKANFEFNGSKIDENIKITNKSDYLILANKLKETCKYFIERSQS